MDSQIVVVVVVAVAVAVVCLVGGLVDWLSVFLKSISFHFF